jgi:hypothetical protein
MTRAASGRPFVFGRGATRPLGADVAGRNVTTR